MAMFGKFIVKLYLNNLFNILIDSIGIGTKFAVAQNINIRFVAQSTNISDYFVRSWPLIC